MVMVSVLNTKTAGNVYHVALCYNVMLAHGHADASQIVMCPVVKHKNGDISATI